MGAQPLLDGCAALRGELAIDIGVQFVFRHRWFAINHRFSSSHFTRRSGGRSPSR
jgi:hypothetical protein